MSTLRQWYTPYAHERVWKQTAHLLLDLLVGVALFTWVITLLSTSAGLLITLVGFPLLALTVASGRWIASAERTRVRVLLGSEIGAWPPLPTVTNWRQRMVQLCKDEPGWKAMLYGLVMLPWGIVTFTVAVVVWSVAWSLALAPFVAWWLPGMDTGSFHPTVLGKVAMSVGAGVLGWLLVAALPHVIGALAAADIALARALLAPSESAVLQQRVSDLQEGRDASTESAALELRRIERDLHDGAQQRLVSVAMNLGMAKDRLEEIDDQQARELVGRAHDEAKQAIVELRELVRGIHPAVLTDRGLDPAVSTLAARCPVPVTVHSDLTRRLPATVEATAYFVVAEALTNIAKHSRATAGTVRLVDRGDTLQVEVHDDGVGGAAAAEGSGLHGLSDRVKAVDGRLRIASPVGGPTTLIAELPCGS